MKLIIGLGNPGLKYTSTRHNVGWKVLDLLNQELGFSFKNNLRTESEIAKNREVILARPQTFMNNSGRSVAKLLKYYDLTPADLIVIHDDLDLPLGAIRHRSTGSSGGHNGVQSIIDHLSTRDFSRIKIGIGRPQSGDPASYVLKPFPKTDLAELQPTLKKAVDLLLKEL